MSVAAPPTASTRALWRAARDRPLADTGAGLLVRFAADEVATRAGALAFFTLLSLIPALLMLSQLLGVIGPSGAVIGQDAVASLDGVAPRSVVALLMHTLGNIDQHGPPRETLSIAALVALWSGSQGVRAAVRAIDVAYGASPRRRSWRGALISIGLTITLVTLLVLALLLLFEGPAVGKAVATQLGLGGAVDGAWRIVQWPIALALVLGGAEMVYRYAPGRDPVQWRMATPGGVVFLVLWLTASLVLRTYFRTFSDLGFAYGPLGAVVMLMLWLYVSAAALIIGGEVNAVLRPDRRAARRTTGQPSSESGDTNA